MCRNAEHDSAYPASMKVGSFSQILFITSIMCASHGLLANGKRSADVSALLTHHTPILTIKIARLEFALTHMLHGTNMAIRANSLEKGAYK